MDILLTLAALAALTLLLGGGPTRLPTPASTRSAAETNSTRPARRD